MNSKTSFFKKLTSAFQFDLRSLAVLRIGLALCVLADLMNRACDLKIFYSDYGVLPRYAFIKEFARKWHWSFHLMNGRVEFQAILFIIAGLCAILLLLGYKTRLMMVLTWILNISLQTRNPMVLQGGDVIFRNLLFWSMFLPLGARYSIDSIFINKSKLPKTIQTIGSFGFITQLLLMYFITAVLKYHPIWLEGKAVYYALQVDQFTTPFGDWLRNFPEVLKGLTYFTIYFEYIAPILLLIPFQVQLIRLVVVPLFIALHLGFIFTLEIGLFPYYCIVAWLTFTPSLVWDKLERFLNKRFPANDYTIYYDADCGFCKKLVYILKSFLILRNVSVFTAQSKESIHKKMLELNSWILEKQNGEFLSKFEAIIFIVSRSPLFFWLVPVMKISFISKLGTKAYEYVASNRMTFTFLTRYFKPKDHIVLDSNGFVKLFGLFAIVYIIIWNLGTLKIDSLKLMPKNAKFIGYIFRWDQYWSMFAPYPMKNDGWYVIVGQLKNGKEVDLFLHNKKVSWEKPKDVSETYPNQRWRKYMMNLRKKKKKDHRLYFGKFVCRDWNRHHRGKEKLETFQIYFMEERTTDPVFKKSTLPVEKKKLWGHRCFKKKS